MNTSRLERREFLATAAAAAAATAAGTALPARAAAPRQPQEPAPGSFKLRYAPHIGMFRHHAGEDPVAQLEFMADQGFAAFEDNGMMARPPEEQEKMAKAMQRRGIAMGIFVVGMSTAWKPSFVTGDKGIAEEFLADCRKAVDVAKRMNATWMTVVPGSLDHRSDIGFQTANVVELLRRACEIFEPHGLVMVLEALNPRDHPAMFLSKAGQAYMVCRAVKSPACRILFDIYHQQISEGNLIPNIDRAWDQIGYFQIGDNPGRNEPGTGEVNYRGIFRHIHAKGYTGILGMEHGNSKPGKDGELAVIEAYRAADSF
jgi:hydroxypyruvate isomerase